MRTTIRLNDTLMSEAKAYAFDRGETFTAVVERALRELLMKRRAVKSRPRVSLPTFRGRGLQPGVDLDSSASLLDRMEDLDAPR